MNNREYTIEDLEELLDNIPYEVWMKDKEGRYKYVNKYFSQKIGCSKKKIIGKTDLDIELGKSPVVNEEKVYYEIYNKDIKREKEIILGSILKEMNGEKNIQDAIIENLIHITDRDAEKNYKKYDSKILFELKKKIKADDIAIYLYNRHSNNMSLYVQEGSTKGIFTTKYSFNVFGQFLLNSKLNKIVRNFNGCQTHYLYPIRAKDTLHGMIEIYYKNDDSKHYIGESIIKQISILLGVSLENRTIAKHLKTELIKREDVQKKLEMVIDTVIDIYALIKKKNNMLQWIDINKKCTEIIEWTDKDLINRSPLELVHADDKEDLKFAVENNKEYKNFVCRILCKSGNYKILSINWSNISNGNIIITGKDITNERELLKDKENLQQAVEVESLKTEFFANLSHEFKTPLNIILSAVQVILSCINNNLESLSLDKLLKYLKGIEQNSYRLLKLANNMIDITKIDGGFYEVEMDNHNIVEVIENIVQSVAEYMNNNKRNITFDTMEEEIITACDPDKIERIILNLLSNSMKFTSVNGKIYVDMDITKDCKNVIIKVRNDGPAISIEDSKKIFNRFTQSENLLTRSVEGSGIGLALVKSLVELHNGKIYVNTHINNGTEFCIELPIRKIMNSTMSPVLNKSINSKVQKYTIEFSDIYTLNQ